MAEDSRPKVSVLTASYNALEGLRHTVRSVEGQSFRDWEHVIVDGGSTDGTLAYLEALGSRVCWISEADSGIAEALNKAVALARGEWALVLQAGDTFLTETSLEEALPYLAGEEDIVSFDVLFATAEGSRRYESRGFTPRINFKTTIPHQGAFCRRRLFDRIGGFQPTLRVGMDYEFFLRAYRAGINAKSVGEVLAEMPDTGVSSQRDWRSLRERFREERRIHRHHTPNPAMNVVYAVYWPLYLTYRASKRLFLLLQERRAAQ